MMYENALFDRFLYILLKGGHLVARLKADDMDLPFPFALPGHPQRGSRNVKSHITAADDRNLFPDVYPPLKLYVPQERKAVVKAVKAFILAGDANALALPPSCADENRLVTHFLDVINGKIHVHRRAVPYFNAALLDIFNLLLYHRLGQAEFRHAHHQHAAADRKRLEYRSRVSPPGEIEGAGQAGGAGPDDRHLPGLCPGKGGRRRIHGLEVFVRCESLQRPDRHGFIEDAPAAPYLAGMVAYAAADGREGVPLPDNLRGLPVITLANGRDVVRYVDPHRAGMLAG